MTPGVATHMIARLRLVFAPLALATAACAAPSSFDGLTGGAKEDARLDAPRPLSPLPVTMVATSRPRLRWELPGQETGAVVEMARSRDFADGAVKTFRADGRELVVPEDLEAGIWFWRLRGRAKGAEGTKASPTWEVLVRGPAARGSSDTPTGSVVDLDGDGLPDLVTAGEAPSLVMGSVPGAVVVVFHGAAGGGFAEGEPDVRGVLQSDARRETAAFSVAAGLDVDGDGYGDLAYAGLAGVELEPGLRSYEVVVERGGPLREGATADVYFPPVPLYPGAIPSLAVGGDLNGDGFGDLLAADQGYAIALFGGRKGPGANALLSALLPESDAAGARAVQGGFDLNGDGLADLVMGPPPSAPSANLRSFPGGSAQGGAPAPADMEPRTATFALGTGDLSVDRPRELSLAQVPEVQASAFASGDFDGDGLADVASTVSVGGASKICVWFGHRDEGVTPGPCAAGLDGDVAFGASLTAGDVEGDGFDEVIATVRQGDASALRVVRFADGPTPTVSAYGGAGFGARVTTLWPGRPGKARFAAVADDAASIGVFEGGTLVRAIARPRLVREDFGRALR